MHPRSNMAVQQLLSSGKKSEVNARSRECGGMEKRQALVCRYMRGLKTRRRPKVRFLKRGGGDAPVFPIGKNKK